MMVRPMPTGLKFNQGHKPGLLRKHGIPLQTLATYRHISLFTLKSNLRKAGMVNQMHKVQVQLPQDSYEKRALCSGLLLSKEVSGVPTAHGLLGNQQGPGDRLAREDGQGCLEGCVSTGLGAPSQTPKAHVAHHSPQTPRSSRPCPRGLQRGETGQGDSLQAGGGAHSC